MKLKNVLLTLGLALGVGAGVGAALAYQSNEPAVEAKAEDVYSRIFLVGDLYNSWQDPYGHESEYKENGLQFKYVGSKDDGHYYQATHDISVGQMFAVRDWEDGHNSDWMKSYDGTKVLQGLENYGNDNNFRCLLTGNYTITYRWASSEDRCIVGFELNNATEMFFIRNPLDSNAWTSSELYIHAWGDNGDLTWSNYSAKVNKIPSIKYSGDNLDFYRVMIPNSANGFMMKGAKESNTSWKTGNLTLDAGTCYTVNNYLNDGLAGSLVGQIFSLMGGFTNDENHSFDNSICAINAEKRAVIATNYSNLLNTEGAKEKFDESTIVTYNPNDLYGNETEVTFASIVDQLAINTINNLPVFGGIGLAGNNSAILLVSAFAVTFAGAGFFFLRRRKEN